MSREGCAVVDPSLDIDCVPGNEGAASIGARIGGPELWAPAHINTQMFSAFGLLEPGGLLSTERADLRRRSAREVPVCREFLADLVPRTWARRPKVHLADALRVELTSRLDMSFLNTNARLARAVPSAEVVTT